MLPGQLAPRFGGDAFINGEIKRISLDDYIGKFVLLLFYPLDFTFVCPTELIAFSEAYDAFQQRNCQIIGCSTDSVYAHRAWVNQDRKLGGLGTMNIPLLSDTNLNISKMYGVLNEEKGISFRGLFLIDPKGVVRSITINDFPVGRSVDEAIRTLEAFTFVDKHGEVCPANWKPNSKTIKPDPVGAQSYFASVN